MDGALNAVQLFYTAHNIKDLILLLFFVPLPVFEILVLAVPE